MAIAYGGEERYIAYCVCIIDYMAVRVDSGIKCKTLDECDYNNGGCEHKCTDTEDSYVCECNEGFFLQENNRGCQRQPDYIDCDYFFGGCDHSCVRGDDDTPDSCRCLSAGFRLVEDKHCIDVNECNETDVALYEGRGACPQNTICINSYGDRQCLTLLGKPANSQASASVQAGLVGVEVAAAENAAAIGTVNTTVIALVAWVVVVTVALVAIAIVAFRRWRRNYSPSDNQSVTSSSNAGSDISDSDSSVGSVMTIDMAGNSNQGFQPDPDSPVAVHIPPADVESTGTRL